MTLMEWLLFPKHEIGNVGERRSVLKWNNFWVSVDLRTKWQQTENEYRQVVGLLYAPRNSKRRCFASIGITGMTIHIWSIVQEVYTIVCKRRKSIVRVLQQCVTWLPYIADRLQS